MAASSLSGIIKKEIKMKDKEKVVAAAITGRGLY